jgi:hypothetical protein
MQDLVSPKFNAVLQDLAAVPIGQAPGDPTPGLAYNRSPGDDYVRCFVRNWSGNKDRRYIKEHISLFGGGEQTAKEKREKGEPFNVEEIRAKISRGQDANILTEGLKSAPALLTFDGKQFLIEPSKDPKKEPPWVPIPSGLMDLYYGNVERLHGNDAREASREMEAVQLRRRVDPCVRLDKQGRMVNPYGYLEFKREIIEPQKMAVDAEQVFAGEYIEV